MKLFVGELANSIHRRVLLGEYVKEENSKILGKNLIQGGEAMNILNQLSWFLGDAYFRSESIYAVPTKHVVKIKICEREADL